MTAWQDEPPRSRRQVRQTERDETVGSSSTPEQDASAEPSFLGVARKGWEADARRASSAEGPPSGRSHGTSGRRAQQSDANQQSDASQPKPEPLAYITQSRPLRPSPDGPTDAVEQPSAEQRPEYRNTDYSPDSRRAAFRPVGPPLDVTPPVVVPRAEPTSANAIQSPPASPRSDLTLTRRQMRELGIGGFASTPGVTDAAEAAAAVAPPVAAVPVAPETVVPEPVVPVDEAPPVVAVPQQRVRLRDRVRQLAGETEAEKAAAQQAAAVEAAAAREAAVPPELIEPPAYQPFLGTSRDEVSVAQIVETPEKSAASSLDAFASQFEVVSADHTDGDVVVAELESHPEPVATFEELLFPSGAPIESTVEPESADAIPMTFDPFVPDQYEAPAAPPAAVPLFAAPVPSESVPSEAVPSQSVLSEFGLAELGFSEPEVAEPEVAVFVEPAASDVNDPADSYRPPFGHWSTQALIDDDEQTQESKLGRDVAATSGAITTNALVLPYLPSGEDMMSPLSGTGEILITGSINLPSSFGSTGAHPGRYDRSDVDALLEADDREDSDPGSAPVRAIRAISTNGTSGDVINSMKPQKASRLPMILIVSAAVMAVGVVVLLVAGLIFKIF